MYAQPTWADGGWGSSEDYETIQTADLDGDGDHELVGRSSPGLEAWDFDVTSGQWLPLVPPCLGDDCEIAWTDAKGWQRKEFFRTIGTGDITGDGKEEIFSRAPNGIQVAEYIPAGPGTGSGWHELDLVNFPDGQNDDIWGQASSYETIQAADLDGDGSAEIFGRSPTGVEILSFDGTRWSNSGFAGFTDSDGWSSREYYTTIQAADLFDTGSSVIFGRGRDGLEVWSLVGGKWQALDIADAPFTNAEGWTAPEHYETIQTADLDGDGDLEVFGRANAGIEAYALSLVYAKNGGITVEWSACGILDAFSNANGWTTHDNYATIQAADVDGDGREEVIGRHGSGMTVWGLQPAVKNCSQQKSQGKAAWVNEQDVAGPGFTNALGWNNASQYATIQVADVDGYTPNGSPGAQGATRAELIGRGPTGIQTYRFDAKAGSWGSPSATWPTWSGNAQTAYEELSQDATPQSCPGAGEPCDIRSLYGTLSSASAYQLKKNLPKAPAAGIPPAVWDDVRAQLTLELTWVYWVAQMREANYSIIQDTFADEATNTTAKHLWKAATDDAYDKTSHAIVADGVQLIAGIADAASNLAPGGEEAAMVAFGIIDAAVSYGMSLNDGASTFSGDLEKFTGDSNWLGKWRQTAQDTNEKVAAQIASDYGLLQAVGETYKKEVWTIPDASASGPTRLAADRAYSTWLWQSLTPSMPAPCDVLLNVSCGGWVIASCDTGQTCLPGFSYGLTDLACPSPVGVACSTRSDVLPGPVVLTSSDGQIYGVNAAPKYLMDQMLDEPSQSCLTRKWDEGCNLGVSAFDVAAGLNGWQYSCSLSVPDSSPPSDYPERVCTELFELRDAYGSR
ncbi:VCBS repeat-containing protein [Microbacterium esteraromaticum]|uniref:FG-GAP repeat domain-containing protein n=1 Tax=Microbacterium esteraromaticum TaxID=57043 RepID=UPI003C309CA3